MKRLFALFLILPVFASAEPVKPWSEVASGTFVLSQDLTLQQKLSFRAGDLFDLREASGLGSVAANYYEFQARKCEEPSRQFDDFEMIRPAQTPKGQDGSVGVFLGPQCVLKIYVDLRDLNLPSFFSETHP